MHSPYTSHLGTNYCPRDEEVAGIKSFLVEPRLRLKQLDDEIAEIQSVLGRLTEKRGRLADYVAAHQALLSPIRRIPVDLMQEIFDACLPVDRHCVMSASEAPVLLGRVCSLWRAISHSTPSLWCRLHIALPHLTPDSPVTSVAVQKKVAQRLQTTQMWLSRSGQCPLWISVDCGFNIPPNPHPLLRVLLPFAARWRDLKLSISRPALETLQHLTAADVPQLRSLRITLSSSVLASLQWERFGILHAPLISSFQIWSPGPGFIAHELPLRWNRLTVLIIAQLSLDSTMTADVILELMARCHELRELRLCVPNGVLSDSYEEGRMIKCPSLQMLHFHCWNLGSHFVLLERLLLPSLRTLMLTGEPQDEIDTQSAAYFFADAPVLESVHIDRITFSKTALLEILRTLPPSVRTLDIQSPKYQSSWDDSTESYVDDDVLALLTPSDPDSEHSAAYCACPGLQTLTIERCNRISDGGVLRFVAARVAVPAPTLKRVQIKFRRQMQVEDLESDLHPYVEAGLDISVTHLPRSFSPWQGLG